ncbi:hypothetical protein PAI11_06350 [Patulibacter medicamentivorans]|uniref:ATP-grasp domain-containing protein n=1 Tax=Patulibacter medicamentivorans TaxID=1097667 RepID=H0E1H3_9ACTN|nr:hypothetical protein [Patulibacter medicamentivorans]EHN12458.1 hypothetical protein PAI11_06350 [Patulibacter medicamentivorans]
MSGARIALATSAAHPDGFHEDELAAALDADWRRWDDPTVDWSAYDAVIVRSTWDYQGRHDEFLTWAARVPQLHNPAPLLRWNTDKRYLLELAEAGLPTVPTVLLAPGRRPAADEPLLRAEHVVKPTVSAGALDTARFAPGEDERRDALLDAIHASGRTAMLQPFVASVDVRGESALLHFDGRLSHAIEKGRILRAGADPIEDDAHLPEIRPHRPTAAELDVAGRLLDHVRERFGVVPLYARVDLVELDGAPVVLELELTEPYLFLGHAPGASARFADAIRARVG